MFNVGYPSTSDYDEMHNDFYKSTDLYSTIKKFTKERSLGYSLAHNLVRIGHNIGAELSLFKKGYPEINESLLNK